MVCVDRAGIRRAPSHGGKDLKLLVLRESEGRRLTAGAPAGIASSARGRLDRAQDLRAVEILYSSAPERSLSP
jgi:hypothetical protein